METPDSSARLRIGIVVDEAEALKRRLATALDKLGK